ncbi:MAG TPA: hypothetical protein VKY73_21310 [Polyangiaceae bacterium]|nr:hypothetical protein [Polyangiaceae bacterium]
MPLDRSFRRAIDRLVSDLSRLAEDVIKNEVARAVARATQVPRAPAKRKTRAPARRRGPSAAEKAALREQRQKEREARRLARLEERERLRAERQAQREAARKAREEERERQRQQRIAEREAERKAREAEREAALAPPPLVVFKRTRDGQVTVLKPRPVAEPPSPPPANQAPAQPE